MKLDLTEIAHSLGMHYTYAVAEDDCGPLASDVVLCAPVCGTLTFSNTGRLLLVRGRLETEVRLECARCLTQFPSPQAFDIAEQFPIHPGPFEVQHAEEEFEEIDESDLDGVEGLYSEGILDLAELIRQYLLVSLPLAPLCRQDCAGLCPHCGVNRNESRCSCEETSDKEVAPLKDLLANWPEK